MMSLEYREVVIESYEQVMCELKMDIGFSKYFLSNMGTKKWCPLPPTLFGLCIDKLNKIVNKGAKQEGLDALNVIRDPINK